ncbi:MAG TPA: hypothetical protein VMV10_27885 [Pirellulales bacterium]|nr:hypothetical protein [Pirellulales bacterium]
MSEPNSAGNQVATDERDDLLEYRPVNPLAVIGLIAGLASVLAFAHPLLWLLPVLGVVICLWALRSLATAATEQVGRKAALVGLTLSLLFGAAAVTRLTIFHWQMRVETRQLAKQWFEALRDGNPYLADQFTRSPSARVQPDDDLLARYAEREERHHLSEYLEEPAIRMLLSLGKYAQVRYFANDVTDALAAQPAVIDIYAVSVRHEGQTTSCFVELLWTRNIEYGTNERYWMLKAVKVLPKPPTGWNQPS